jgi:hypothetical protein
MIVPLLPDCRNLLISDYAPIKQQTNLMGDQKNAIIEAAGKN